MCRRFESAPRHHASKAMFLPRRALSIIVCFWVSGGEYRQVVPKVGVEPTWAKAQRFLRPSRLPFRHFGNPMP